MVADFTEITENTEISGFAITVSAELADIAEKSDETEVAVIEEFAAVAEAAIIAKNTGTVEFAQVSGLLANAH